MGPTTESRTQYDDSEVVAALDAYFKEKKQVSDDQNRREEEWQPVAPSQVQEEEDAMKAESFV